MTTETKLADEWECFQDAAYFDMHCVRLDGVRTFGMLRKYKGEHIGYDPEPFKDKASMAKAQAAIAAVFDALDI